MGEAFKQLGINFPFLLAQIVNFLLLFGALSVLLWKPVMRGLEARRQRLEQEKADRVTVAEARANIEAERARALEEARGEAEKILAETRGQARALAEQAAQEARQEVEKVRAQAREAAEEERNRILGEMRGQIAALAIAAANKIIGETLDEQRQRALVDSFFSGVRTGQVEILAEARDLRGEVALVTTAVPLTEEEQATLRRDVAAQLGGEPQISFRVAPEILGGLIIRVGDRVVDGSVAGQLERLRQAMA